MEARTEGEREWRLWREVTVGVGGVGREGRDEIVIREVHRSDREGVGAAGPGEGEVQLTASFVGRRGRRETEVEGVKEREESSRVAGVGEMDVEVTQQDSRGRQRGEGGE